MAQFKLALAYFYGKGISEDKKEAVRWYKKAAESGDAYCAFQVGECYRLGEGVEKNEDIAIDWYIKGANGGDCESMFQVAEYYFHHNDLKQAFMWYSKAAKSDKDHDTIAQERLDKYFYVDGTPRNSAEELNDLISKAAQGDAESKLKLGDYYYEKDQSKAIKLYKEAAETGLSKAIERVINLYVKFEEPDEDDEEWEEYYWDNDEDDEDMDYFDYSDKDCDLNYLYINKDGDALKWFRKAAEFGNAQALFMMGECYYYGWHVEKNKTNAIEWYKKAMKAGFAPGEKRAELVELEIKWKIDHLRWSSIYRVEAGTKVITSQFFKESKYSVIHIPASVQSIEEKAFADSQVKTIVCDSPKDIKVQSMKGMFSGCTELSDISFLAEWNISNVVSMEGAFCYCISLKDISPLKKWDVSNVNNMSQMFMGCYSMIDISPIAKWNVCNVRDMTHMFASCNQLSDISAFKFWNLPSMQIKGILNVHKLLGLIRNCDSINDVSSLKNWGLTEKDIVQYLVDVCSHDTTWADYKRRKATDATSNNTNVSSITQQTETPVTNKPSENNAIDKCEPYVFFVKAIGYDITYSNGTRKQLKCDSDEGDMQSWTGTGFLLADGRFITARHVVEPWAFPSGSGELDASMVALNIITNNGGRVIAKFIAISSNGTQIQFTSDQCVINHTNDKVRLTDNGAKIIVANIDYTDYAYFQTGRTTGLRHNNTASTSLVRSTKLVVLGFPLGIGANSATDINPIYGSGIVAVNGLQNGVILTTDTNYEQGNSGGPVFKANSNGDLEVIGLVSAGAGRTMGFIVPIASVK